MPGKLSDLVWGPLFARGYDRFIKSTEDAGLRDKRRSLLAGAKGRTLEIGAGTGTNLPLYPDSVSELILTEPDPHMRHQLEKRAPAGADVVDAAAERLPFPDASFDTVVATLVFCTIPDPQAALSEIARILSPAGGFSSWSTSARTIRIRRAGRIGSSVPGDGSAAAATRTVTRWPPSALPSRGHGG